MSAHTPGFVHADPGASFSGHLTENPLLAEWTGDYGGLPPFDRIQVEMMLPAVEAGIALMLEDVARIAENPEPPTFANTLEAFERAGAPLRRARLLISVWRLAMNDPAFREVEGEIMVRLTELADLIVQNSALFQRIRVIHEQLDSLDLAPEQRRLVWYHYSEFAREGAELVGKDRERLASINQRLAELATAFDQNLLGDESEYSVVIEDEAGLAGLPDSEREAAASSAERLGLTGKWVISNTRSAVEPFLTCARRRDLREKVWRMFIARGSGVERDNRPVISEMLALRAERAKLLGFRSHAHWAAQPQMTRVPERAVELMEAVWPAAVRRVLDEVELMLPIARQDGVERIEPWDYRFYAEKVRQPIADLDWDEVTPYLGLDRLRDGMFWVAGELFGLDFRPVQVPVYHPDLLAWEVSDRENDQHVGLFYFDPFARPGKKSGAWMDNYREQERLGPSSPIVSNNCNYLPGRPGEPVTLSWSDARTLFHEFGHALHGLLSEATYPSLSGTAVPTDYVEFPSQLLEHWLSNPEFLRRFALHSRTGAVMPSDLVERIELAARLGRGFSTVEEMASGIVDMRLHLLPEPLADVEEFEKITLEAIGMPSEMVMRHRLPHFSHIFSGDFYAARYYSYLWADVLASDAAEAFREAGGMYDPATAQRLRSNVLSRGNTIDPELGWLGFRGRAPDVKALMRNRGFPAG
ncbi:MAG: M3 family metallopeptidase [Gemmatimonadota bacterium]|nr:M3 family metallopeptidase [Gemmatimonadota bacterium]